MDESTDKPVEQQSIFNAQEYHANLAIFCANPPDEIAITFLSQLQRFSPSELDEKHFYQDFHSIADDA